MFAPVNPQLGQLLAIPTFAGYTVGGIIFSAGFRVWIGSTLSVEISLSIHGFRYEELTFFSIVSLVCFGRALGITRKIKNSNDAAKLNQKPATEKPIRLATETIMRINNFVLEISI